MEKKTTRSLIISASDKLFYEKGYENTSFSDISQIVDISRGNLYHHFKTKDDILDAVICYRMSNTQTMLDEWESKSDQPIERVLSFVNILIRNKVKIKKFGCPVGTLNTELAKLNHSSHNEQSKIFTLFREWLKRQFTLLGRRKDADELAMHILARSQGVATLANAFKEEKFIKQEVEQMREWLRISVTN